MIFLIIFNHDEAKVEFIRVQLSIRISYAMTINKTQRQRLKRYIFKDWNTQTEILEVVTIQDQT